MTAVHSTALLAKQSAKLSDNREGDTSAPPKTDETRQRLIEAAGEIFAEVGYEAATVRRITSKAQANLSAVNYYFGDKKGLYQTILQSIGESIHAFLRARCAQGAPEERLRSFVCGVLSQENAERRSWAHLLMAREVLELHAEQVDAMVAGASLVHKLAEELVRDLVGPRIDPARLKMAAGLLVSTCINQIFQQRLDKKIYPELSADQGASEETVEQLYQFVRMGILGLMKPKKSFAKACAAVSAT